MVATTKEVDDGMIEKIVWRREMCDEAGAVNDW